MRRFMMLIAGVFCGALVGGLTALLLAPASGKDLQARFQERINSIREEIREAYETRMQQLEAELEALRKPASPVGE